MKTLSNIMERISKGQEEPLYRMSGRMCILYWFALIGMVTLTFFMYQSGDYGGALASAACMGALGVCLFISALLPKKVK